MKTFLVHGIVAICLQLAGCNVDEAREDMVPTDITGIDHLAEHLSIQNFWVDGRSGFQAGGGGSAVCCVSLPRKWHPGLAAVVEWNTTNWRDCGWESRERRVPIERYDQVGALFVHFLSDGSVRAVSSNISPGYSNPDYLGPHDPIPRKQPWRTYDAQHERCPDQGEPTVMERAE